MRLTNFRNEKAATVAYRVSIAIARSRTAKWMRFNRIAKFSNFVAISRHCTVAGCRLYHHEPRHKTTTDQFPNTYLREWMMPSISYFQARALVTCRVGIPAAPPRGIVLRVLEAVLISASRGSISQDTNSLIFRRTTSAVGLLRKSILRVSSNSSKIADLAELSNSGSWTKTFRSDIANSNVAVSVWKTFSPVTNS
jgi:hypothetical protein